MNEIRRIVLTQEQGEALGMLLDNSKRHTKDPRGAREHSVKVVLEGHTTWEDIYKPLNVIPLSDLLYVVTGGHWEIQKTVRGVLEGLKETYRNNHISSASSALTIAIERLEKEGLI
ncbi:hypothetical protein Riggi_58 [Bacillus phage Riggi]|uniref:Uncharacterized protein n=1 Tax=Bacillus phage Riggi TaxID=2884426 RepID=U5PW44_9CAUD|nr:hypothetical protein Riggi_58 [Bacillus phage Riggi]AGY48220.1 hypothetical protein Riggi_58 [Bacillus phage Riggi]